MSAKTLVLKRACRAHILAAQTNQRIYQPQLQALQRPSAFHSSSRQSNNSGIPRRSITVTSDDGRYSWSQLSTGEKAARTTQQSFNFLLVGAGAVATAAVAYLLYTELFAADSKTRQFNRAVDRIKADPKCRELLGPASQITAFGEPTSNKWARARPLAHTAEIDNRGISHLRMHFNVEGPDGRGQVQLHMTKRPDQDELEYRLLSLTVPGHQTIYLENADAKAGRKNTTRMFGVQWGK